ncbi:polysaccharide deacetylase family protein [candidate division CSSED10-310 bacterium]|uniref:Polysaccharide deacetylase family protein n=1 Tax=candidate division CSSED10-310 bacterium TaxID=2855610 RepID=A0ABV6Z263_UNCC1
MYVNHRVWKLDRRLDLILKFVKRISLDREDARAFYNFNRSRAIIYLSKTCNLDVDELEEKGKAPGRLLDILDEYLTDRQKRILLTYIKISRYLINIIEVKVIPKETIPAKVPVVVPVVVPVETTPIEKPPSSYKVSFAVSAAILVMATITFTYFRYHLDHQLSRKHDDGSQQSITNNLTTFKPLKISGENESAIRTQLNNKADRKTQDLSAPENNHPPSKDIEIKTASSKDRALKLVSVKTEPEHPVQKAILKNTFLKSGSIDSIYTTHADLPLNIIRGNTQEKKISLTFDGDSQAQDTEFILEALKQYNVTCTFFLTGKFIEKFPEQVMKIVHAGHEVGNHTYSHAHMYSISDQEFRKELIKCDQVFFKLCGKHMIPYWRAPYGEYNKHQAKIAKELGYTHVHWTHWKKRKHSLDTVDWVEDENSTIFYSAEEITHHILSSDYKEGGIVLLHVGARTTDPLYLKFPEIIKGLRSQGYQIITISEMIKDIIS